ncbi:class I SAM-dependent methyltransferase [Tenacibaculum tangerinum]|uniref:Class I SAM-dependent methyltransferase n=1 Tax=Tenacibaculum tangerinum TaxID=3038772 RepID=A0ABY8L699_9FLAO|nr:class I SAM-dependent methyltransferase [Tenacibaculum tangerinum]WGH76916.1 class I SAM-dependent methyltransferase [Tenacibaculum tangerinum]
MKKITKHLLIFKRRITQQHELKKLSKIENDTLQKVINAFIVTQKKLHKNEDLNSFSNCENYRTKLLADNTPISYKIFSSDKVVSVREICKKAASGKKWCQFLYHLVDAIDAPKVLEIGTNLGISGSYILEAMKNKNGKLTTMEGLPQLCEISAAQFATIVPNSKFEVIQGLYENTFSKVIENKEEYDILFIDGNHQKAPTLEYFKALKATIKKTAIFVFDDIYWSDGMTEAWEIIKKDKDVNFSIDLYEQGIVIIDKNEPIHHKEFSLHLSY